MSQKTAAVLLHMGSTQGRLLAKDSSIHIFFFTATGHPSQLSCSRKSRGTRPKGRHVDVCGGACRPDDPEDSLQSDGEGQPRSLQYIALRTCAVGHYCHEYQPEHESTRCRGWLRATGCHGLSLRLLAERTLVICVAVKPFQLLRL